MQGYEHEKRKSPLNIYISVKYLQLEGRSYLHSVVVFFTMLFLNDSIVPVCFSSEGSNGQVSYGGLSEESFSINPVTGVITTTKSLDREVQEYYTVTGTALSYMF